METTFEPSHQLRPLAELRAIDAMHPGMISCPPETPLRTVARMMASYRVHAIVVHAHDDDQLPGGANWGVVTDADLVRAALQDNLHELTASQVAATPVLTVNSIEPLVRAMQLMTDHEVAHVIVVKRHSGRPIGLLSTLDVARALASAT
jgi:signal-transduction protein with cAMP-binding, CBS, and nucleotidyltransferase domain